MNFAGNAVFNNLALIFSFDLAVGLAKGDKGSADLAGGVAYLVYTATISGFLQLFSPKTTIDTGVLGAIVIGCTVAYLHNHYRKIQLPQFLGFFWWFKIYPDYFIPRCNRHWWYLLCNLATNSRLVNFSWLCNC